MHKSLLAALTVAALSSTAAFAQGTSNQPATRNPTPLGRDSAPTSTSRDNAPRTYSYQDEALPPAADARQAQDDRDPRDNAPRASAEEERARDIFCRRDAARRTGYTSPGAAARNEQARGTIGGTLGGAALGAIIGGAAGNAGAGAAIGAGAGLVAGSAIGADNARRAASDAEAEYGDAYYACLDTAQDDLPPPDGRYDDRYANDYPPPPPVYYAPRPYPYYYQPYYGPRFYGPSLGFSFGIGSSFGGGYRGGFAGPRGGFAGPRGGFGGPRGGFRGRR